MSAAEIEQDDKPEAPLPPEPKERLAPKLGLQGSIAFIVGLRQRARMSDGKDATEAWLLLEPEDLERLDDLADELEKMRLARVVAKDKEKQEERRREQRFSR